jgi:hypothetical protein
LAKALIALLVSLLIPALLDGARSLANAEPDDDQAFTVAVLRRDGVLIPFANHRRGRWSNDWPEPGKPFDVPITLDDVPDEWWGHSTPVTAWTLWRFQGNSHQVRATVPARYPAQCLPGFGFRTDYRSDEPVPPPTERPHPKDGLATSASARVEKVEILDERAPEWSDLQQRIAPAFAEVEREVVRRFSKWNHPATASERERMPVRIEQLYRVPLRGAGELYYVEASRAYDDPSQKDDCDAVTLVSGWVRPWRPADKVFDLSAVITLCDRADATYVLPLGLIRPSGDRSPVWVLQVAGWDVEHYVAVETGRDANRILVSAFGGSCPRDP